MPHAQIQWDNVTGQGHTPCDTYTSHCHSGSEGADAYGYGIQLDESNTFRGVRVSPPKLSRSKGIGQPVPSRRRADRLCCSQS